MLKLKKLLIILIYSLTLIYPIIPSFGDNNSNTLIFLVNLLGLIVIYGFNCNKNLKSFIKVIMQDKLFILLLFFNVFMYLSYFNALNKHKTLLISIQFTLFILLFFVISHTINNNKSRYGYIISIILSNIFVTIFSLYQLINNHLKGLRFSAENRLSSTLENSNSLGMFSILSFFLVLSLTINIKNKMYKTLLSLILLLGLINIVGSLSRNALLGLLIGIFLLPLFYSKKYFFFSLAAPLIILLIPQTRNRLLNVLSITQNSSRIKIWKTTILMIKDNFFTGIGYENYGEIYPIYITNNKELMVWDGYRAFHPHNLYLKLQVELGIFGLIIFLAFSLYTIYLLIHFSKLQRYKINIAVLIGVNISFISFLFMNLIDSFFTSPKILISLIILLALGNSILYDSGIK